MQRILFLNTETLIGALFWCNLTAVGLLFIYYRKCQNSHEKKTINYLVLNKLLHAIAYFMFFGRGILPQFLSVNIGNSAFFVGFYLEAQVILLIIRERTVKTTRILFAMLIFSLCAFNIMDYLAPLSGSRVTMASLGVIFIMVLPNIMMIRSRDSSSFAKITAAMYLAFMILLLPRAWYSLVNQDVGILTSTALQSLTFESLLMLLFFSIPAYIIIEKEYTDSALRLMATTDKLTGATNRHAFTEAVTAVYKDYIRLKNPMSILFIDIDYFKKVNDQYGHAFGDEVLARLSELIDRCLRNSDLSCRYGGEEFVIMLTRADHNTAERVAQRIMEEVRQTVFESNKDFRFTVSIGVYSGIPTKEQSVDTFIGFADEAMYEAKRNGRNKMVSRF